MPDINLGDNYSIDEDSNGDLVIKDTNDNTIFRWDDTNGTWTFDNNPIEGVTDFAADSVSTDALDITGVVADVSNHGAVGDGSTDDSAAIQTAIDAVKSDGGTVVYPPGTYLAEGLEYHPSVEHRPLGAPMSATLQLPNSPSTHLFVADSGVSLDGAGVVGLKLDGGGTTTYDGIHCDDATVYESGEIDAFITGFRRGYSGSQDDRAPLVISGRINNNTVGVYVNNNHPTLEGFDIRSNTTGLGGDIFDMSISDGRFVRNDYGVRPLNGASIQNTQFDDCIFYKNQVQDAEIGLSTSIIGGMMAPDASTGRGVHINGDFAKVSDVQFRYSNETYSGAAVEFTNSLGVDVSDNNFDRVGTAISARDDTITGRPMNVTENEARLDTASAQFFAQESSQGELPKITISDNDVMVSTSLNNAVIEINSALSLGWTATGNDIYGESGVSGDYLSSADATNALIKNNQAHRITGQSLTGTPATNTDNVTTT